MPVTHLLKVSRLEGLTDGVFSIAMTIMVLNLHVPEQLKTPDVSIQLQSNIYTNLYMYAGSFIILGTHWIAMNFQWGLLEKLNRIYLWANMFYLMAVCVIPFSSNLLVAYPHSIYSINFYAINLLCTSLGQIITLQCAQYYRLNKNTYRREIYLAALLRILVAPVFYVSSLIMAHWDTTIAFILLVLPTAIYLIPGRIDHYEGVAPE